MKINPFALERYFAKYEFNVPHLLSSSDCEPFTLQELLELADTDSRKLWDGLILGYTESQGLPALRQEVSKLYEHITPEQSIILTPEEGIFIAMNVLLEAGDHVIVTNPGYQSLYEIATSLGCAITKWEPNPETWEFDVDFVKEHITPKTKLLVINFPHNPTGSQLSKVQLNELISVARQHNLTIFSDEMYRLLEYDEKDRLPSVADVYENGISLFGMSKSFALAGLRIGWLTTQNQKLLDELRAFKDYTTICNSAPSEVLAVIALHAKDKIIQRNLDIITNNTRIFDQFVKRHQHVMRWTAPKAGSIGFPEYRGGDVTEFCQNVVKRAGVMILPTSVYDFTGNNFRVGLGRKSFITALKVLDKYISTQ